MPKKIFWPASLVTMGFIFLASNLGYLPREFWNLWPIILIVVGLGGLLTSDKDEWMIETKTVSKNVSKKSADNKPTKKPAKKSAKKGKK